MTKHDRDQEERHWAAEGEARLATFDERNGVSHEDAWASLLHSPPAKRSRGTKRVS